MNSFLTTPSNARSESLAFLSLSASDLDCLDRGLETSKSDICVVPKVQPVSQEDQARIALCDLVQSLAEAKSADEFVARRDRLFARYQDLMLGLGRIVNALTDSAEVFRRTKVQIAGVENFFKLAKETFCPSHLKDQALFSLWELGKVVDLVNFIVSRPLPDAALEEDQRQRVNCTNSLIYGRLHLDCLIFSIAARRRLPDDIQDLLSEGMRHFVNGHIAARIAARLRQQAIEVPEVELLEIDDEDRFSFAHAISGTEDDEY